MKGQKVLKKRKRQGKYRITKGLKKIKTSNSKKNAAQSLKDLQNPKFIAKPVILPNIIANSHGKINNANTS